MHNAQPGSSHSSSSGRSGAARTVVLDLFTGLAAAAALAVALQTWLVTPSAWVVGSVAVYLALAATIYGCWMAGTSRTGPRADFGWANRVTLARTVLVAVLCGVLAAPEVVDRHGAILAALALLAIVLDALDGWLARTIGNVTRFGARFDMEIDALLILVLSISVVMADRAGPWVLAIGGMRYAFIVAGWVAPWLQRDLPDSTWRKTVCVVQGIVLAVALLPWLPVPLVQVVVALSLAGLVHSFGRDTLWLRRNR